MIRTPGRPDVSTGISTILFLAAALGHGVAAAQSPASPGGPADLLMIPRLTGAVVVDGVVDEAAWVAVAPLRAYMHLPTSGGEPTERTVFRVAYDDEAIYLSCENHDSDPAGIQAPTLRRDASNLTNDWCVLQLDTFNDKETAVVFGTTPAGIRTDAVWPNDGQAAGNFTWNTFWDAAVRRDSAGWTAEIRVPLSSLRFQDQDGDGITVMGLSVWRGIARKNELAMFPLVDSRVGGFTRASLFREVGFEGIQATRPVYVTPYVMGAAGRTWTEAAAGSGSDPVRDEDLQLGGDLKYALASNLTLDLTVNTDFAQAEADDQQVNLTRFSLFFPEKRLFFQERGETFSFSVGGNERLFHSRRIGLAGGGPVPILAGARVVGRVGAWDVGLLDMQTRKTTLGPSENLGVFRLRRRVLNDNSYVGGIVTSRFAEAGAGHDVLYGLDGIFRLFGQDYVAVNWAQSFAEDGTPDAAPAVDVDMGARSLARAYWERRGSAGLTYGAELSRAGEVFSPGLGYLQRQDYTKVGLRSGWEWRPVAGASSWFHTRKVNASGTVYRRNADGSTETVELSAGSRLELRSRHAFSGDVTSSYEDLREGFSVAEEADIPAGEYRFTAARLSYTPPEGSLLRATVSLEAGQYYDGRIVSGSVSPTWFASRHLELGGTWQSSRVTFPERGQAFTAHVLRLRTQVMASARLLATAFVQYNGAVDRVSGNVRLRYNPSEGHNLYLVWNEQLITDRVGLDPVPPLSENRVLVVKYARTFTFTGQ